MASLCAIIPVASLANANASLKAQGFGDNNFSVPAYTGAGATHGALHAWNNVAFSTAVKAIAGVVWEESDGDPSARTKALIEAQGAKWGANAPQLPTSGTAVVGALYRYPLDKTLWSVIQAYDLATWQDPYAIPALIRQVREPNQVLPWKQPIDQYDAYKLVNPFTGKPDQCTFGGSTWKVVQADGSGNNVWQPGVFGWVVVS